MKRIVLDIEKQRKYQREWKKKRREDAEFYTKELEKNKAWREANKESIAEKKKKYYAEKYEEIKNRKKTAYENRKKRFVGFDDELTSLVYREAQRLVKLRKASTGFSWSVDHILPLIGKEVSGLHVWNNIQVMPLTTNKRKYNNHEEVSSRY